MSVRYDPSGAHQRVHWPVWRTQSASVALVDAVRDDAAQQVLPPDPEARHQQAVGGGGRPFAGRVPGRECDRRDRERPRASRRPARRRGSSGRAAHRRAGPSIPRGAPGPIARRRAARRPRNSFSSKTATTVADAASRAQNSAGGVRLAARVVEGRLDRDPERRSQRRHPRCRPAPTRAGERGPVSAQRPAPAPRDRRPRSRRSPGRRSTRAAARSRESTSTPTYEEIRKHVGEEDGPVARLSRARHARIIGRSSCAVGPRAVQESCARDPIRSAVDEANSAPIRALLFDDDSLVRLDAFVVALGESIDAIQDSEHGGQLEEAAKRAADLARDARSLGLPPLAIAAEQRRRELPRERSGAHPRRHRRADRRRATRAPRPSRRALDPISLAAHARAVARPPSAATRPGPQSVGSSSSTLRCSPREGTTRPARRSRDVHAEGAQPVDRHHERRAALRRRRVRERHEIPGTLSTSTRGAGRAQQRERLGHQAALVERLREPPRGRRLAPSQRSMRRTRSVCAGCIERVERPRREQRAQRLERRARGVRSRATRRPRLRSRATSKRRPGRVAVRCQCARSRRASCGAKAATSRHQRRASLATPIRVGQQQAHPRRGGAPAKWRSSLASAKTRSRAATRPATRVRSKSIARRLRFRGRRATGSCWARDLPDARRRRACAAPARRVRGSRRVATRRRRVASVQTRSRSVASGSQRTRP